MSPPSDAMIVTLTAGQLAALVRDAVQEALAEQYQVGTVPVLHDRQGLGQTLGCSLATVDRMRREAGFPELRVGDAARFELAEVLAWLRNRQPSAEGAESRKSRDLGKHAENDSNATRFRHRNSGMEA